MQHAHLFGHFELIRRVVGIHEERHFVTEALSLEKAPVGNDTVDLVKMLVDRYRRHFLISSSDHRRWP